VQSIIIISIIIIFIIVITNIIFIISRQGVKTATYNWPGSEVDFHLNESSTFYTSMPSRNNVRFRAKVIQAIDWFVNQDYKFVSIYNEQPDQISHKYGINSPEFNVTLEELDQEFGYLIFKLKETNLYHSHNFNVIIVSSHVS
jgi:ectonucleotide pyrophosphatase/phosphodiesterase family protein 7